MARRYFSGRKDAAPAITTQDFAYRFRNILVGFVLEGYFVRLDMDSSYEADYISHKLRRELAIAFGPESHEIIPTKSNLLNMSRDSIFDLIEFLSDYVLDPPDPDSPYLDTAVRAKYGLETWRTSINEYLEQLDPPHNLTADRKIEIAAPSAGLRRLVDDHASPSPDAQEMVDHACRMFLKRDATAPDRRSALEELASVLEPLRKDLEASIGKKDAGRLFDIANNYGIRHNDRKQMELDENYARWFFYTALAAIDLVARLDKSTSSPQK